MVYGSFALDDGAYIISESEYEGIIDQESFVSELIKPFIKQKSF